MDQQMQELFRLILENQIKLLGVASLQVTALLQSGLKVATVDNLNQGLHQSIGYTEVKIKELQRNAPQGR